TVRRLLWIGSLLRRLSNLPEPHLVVSGGARGLSRRAMDRTGVVMVLETIVPAAVRPADPRRVGHVDRINVAPLGPQVDHVGGDFGHGVVVLADRPRGHTGHATNDGHFAATGEDFRIVEARAAGDETAFAGVAVTRPRGVGQLAREDLDARSLRFGFDLDHQSTPADGIAGASVLDDVIRRNDGDLALQL